MKPFYNLYYVLLYIGIFLILSTCTKNPTSPDNFNNISSADSTIIVNHTSKNLSSIPDQWIIKARTDLRIAYGHTSHGSQLITGMSGLIAFKGNLYRFNGTGADSALELRDNPFSGAYDLGNPNRTAWATATRTYLNTHPW